MNRTANNRFEVDLLPPYGQPEVSIIGEAASYASLVFVTGLLVSRIFNE